MNGDRESILKPLRSVADSLSALRTGDTPSRARAVVRVSGAAETSLRRLLRDDPTAPVELRLRALSAEDVSADELLTELRRRDRIPMELAAAFHELSAAARRIQAGDEPTPRDSELALGVVEGLDRHLASHHVPPPLADPVAAREDTLIAPAPQEEPARAVPSAGRRPWGLIAAGALVLALLVFGALWLTTLRRDDALAQGEAALREGRAAEAETQLRGYADRHPNEALPHLYLARIYRQGRRFPDAVRELKAGLAAAPNDARLHAEGGYLLLDAGRPADAVARFRTALRYDETLPTAWGGLVRALRESGHPDQADRVLAVAPADVRALLARGMPAGPVGAAGSPTAAPAGTAPGAAPPAVP
jgi:tetratricopeptide (TPR) repeat protein